MQDYTYVKNYYIMQKCFDEVGVSNWVTGIRKFFFVFKWTRVCVEKSNSDKYAAVYDIVCTKTGKPVFTGMVYTNKSKF